MGGPDTGAPSRILGTPIVLERQSRRKKKRKPRLKEADRMERYLYRAAQRTADATNKGLRRYRKARRSSARRERDGAIVDLMPNMARGMAAGAGRMAPVPLDLLRAASTGSMRRTTRRSVRAMARVLERS